MSKKYGKTSEEEKAEKSLKCRQIVAEINRFGVSESQRIQIIKLLALELENNLNMKKIINTINEIVENNDIHEEENKLIGL
tara:strand:- start:287 stop:529 length:243 start_codon:yes stop_codon:yes gene_type:complete